MLLKKARSMKKIGKKTKRWFKDKQRLELDYLEKGIIKCERCHGSFGLSFHHLDKRSRKETEHTFENTVLLCGKCHNRADNEPGFEDFNNKLRKLR